MEQPTSTFNFQIIPKIRVLPDDGVAERPRTSSDTPAQPSIPPEEPLTTRMPGTFPSLATSTPSIHSARSLEVPFDLVSITSNSPSSQTSYSSETHEHDYGSREPPDLPPKSTQGKCKKGDKKNKPNKAARQAAFREAHGTKGGTPEKSELLHEQLARDLQSTFSGPQLLTSKPTDVGSTLGGSSGTSTPKPAGQLSPSKDGQELQRSKSAKHKPNGTLSQRQRRRDIIFTLDDFEGMIALQSLFVRYGGASHMGILDRSYSFFVNKARTGGLYFKVHDRVAVVGGDPLCPPDQFHSVLTEFKEYRKKFRWRMTFLGASDTFAEYAREQKWSSIQFGVERVLNPLDNPVLLEQTGKRMIGQNRQLLNPDRFGLTLHVYVPSQGENLALQAELLGIYESWRKDRDETRSNATQAFITVYDPFSLPSLMVYLYTRDRFGTANGFAALRSTGATGGYHIDPYIAAPGAPRGVSDLLIFASMALLNKAGIDNLSLGFEPLEEIGAVYGIGRIRESLMRSIYKKSFTRLPVQGKRQYHNKFRPDESKGSGLHLVFADGRPRRKHMVALAHTANIKISRMLVSSQTGKKQVPRGSSNAIEVEGEKNE